MLHWHVVDAQSFPFESRAYPALWDGAYSRRERYTREDVASIVQYARARGVRVIVEFDMPGHADSWCVVIGRSAPPRRAAAASLSTARGGARLAPDRSAAPFLNAAGASATRRSARRPTARRRSTSRATRRST